MRYEGGSHHVFAVKKALFHRREACKCFENTIQKRYCTESYKM